MKKLYASVNPADYNALSDAGKDGVLAAVRKGFPDAVLALDPAAPVVGKQADGWPPRPGCKEACAIAEKAALAACNLLGSDIERAICAAAARAAADECRRHCD